MKLCAKCRIEKPLTEFWVRASGRASYCKVCSLKHHKLWVKANRAKHREYTDSWAKRNPRYLAYAYAKMNARKRGIVFLITREEWVKWWGSDFEFRGTRYDSLQMCRFDDQGSYRIGNIYKASKSENSAGPRMLPVPTW